MFSKPTLAIYATFLLATSAGAHHSVLNYDGKIEITISGTVTSARFGYPHSVYRIDVEGEDVHGQRPGTPGAPGEQACRDSLHHSTAARSAL